MQCSNQIVLESHSQWWIILKQIVLIHYFLRKFWIVQENPVSITRFYSRSWLFDMIPSPHTGMVRTRNGQMLPVRVGRTLSRDDMAGISWHTLDPVQALGDAGDATKLTSVTVIQHLLGSSSASGWHPGWTCLRLGSHHFLLDKQQLLALHWDKQNCRGVLTHVCLRDKRSDPQLLKVNGNTFMKSRRADFQAVIACHLRPVILSSVTPAQSHLNMYQNNSRLQLWSTVWSNSRPSFV